MWTKKKFCQVGLTHTKANSKLLLSYETLRKSIFLTLLLRIEHALVPGGVRTMIALHHGRKAKNKSFASCRGRVNISGSSKIA